MHQPIRNLTWTYLNCVPNKKKGCKDGNLCNPPFRWGFYRYLLLPSILCRASSGFSVAEIFSRNSRYLDPIKETFNKNTDPRIESTFEQWTCGKSYTSTCFYQITLKKSGVFGMLEDIQTYLACSNFSSRAAAFAFNRSTWKQRTSQKSMRLKNGWHILSIDLCPIFNHRLSCILIMYPLCRPITIFNHCTTCIITSYRLKTSNNEFLPQSLSELSGYLKWYTARLSGDQSKVLMLVLCCHASECLNAFKYANMKYDTNYTLGPAKTLQWWKMKDDIASFLK